MFLEWENNSGKFQNNAVNDAKQISLSHVIKIWIINELIDYYLSKCMSLHVTYAFLEWIHTTELPECQGTPCSKQVRYLKFKWL